MELVGNLMDNACKSAREKVGLDIRQGEQGLKIEVSDDGPGGVLLTSLVNLRNAGSVAMNPATAMALAFPLYGKSLISTVQRSSFPVHTNLGGTHGQGMLFLSREITWSALW